MRMRIAIGGLAVALAVPLVAQTGAPASARATADKLADKLINLPMTASWTVYGAGQTNAPVSDGPKGYPATRVTVRAKGANTWDAGATTPIVKPIAAGDTIAIAVYLRAPMLKDGETTSVSYLGINRASAPYTMIAQASANVTNQWKVYYAAGKTTTSQTADSITVAIHLAADKHVIDLGPVRAYDLGPTVDPASLPKNG